MNRREHRAAAKIRAGAAETGDPAQAEHFYRKSLRTTPEDPTALSQLAVSAAGLGRWREALRLVERRLAVQPQSTEAHFQRGAILQELGRLSEALEEYEKALNIQPDYIAALHNRGTSLIALGRFEAALAHWDGALLRIPNHQEWHFGRAYVLAALRRFEEALIGYNRALRLRPGDPVAHNNRGNVLKELGRFAEALDCFSSALALQPQYAEAYGNRGNVLKEMARPAEALMDYDHAIALQPTNALVHHNRGILLHEQQRVEEAAAAFRRALRFQPTLLQAEASLVYALAQLCDWSEPTRSSRLLESVRQGTEGIPPWIMVNQDDSTLQDQLRCAQLWAKRFPSTQQFRHQPRPPKRKIQLGYLSADFRDHATSYLIAELLELHSRERFEITAYSYGLDDGSEMRRRIMRGVDRFVELRHTDLRLAANEIYKNGTDILIDMMGYTRDARTGILSFRPAPIQVNFLGYPGTMGADFIDYIIVDPWIAPMAEQPFCTERLVQLPECYQPSDTHRQPGRALSRAECGLPAKGFVFCCFNNSYKIRPPFFDIWMRLLDQVPNSVLWLFKGYALVEENLKREAVARGIAAERLKFSERVPVADYLARLSVADLFLDTLPYNAGATANDALWAGLPVLTCTGEGYTGRMAGSLLRAAGLPELVAGSPAEYEALALRLANEPGLLEALRLRLNVNRRVAPLFDMARYTKHLERAYRQMWGIRQQDRPPTSFAVEPLRQEGPGSSPWSGKLL